MMHTYECDRCAYNVMGSDAIEIAEAKFQHKDFHKLEAEFAAKNTRTYECPLRDCAFTLSGTDIQAGIDEHEAAHLEDADEMQIAHLAEAEIIKPTHEACGGGMRIILDQITEYGRFGEVQRSDYEISVDKAHGVDDDPSLHPSQIPALILELERLHNVWLEQIHPNSDK